MGSIPFSIDSLFLLKLRGVSEVILAPRVQEGDIDPHGPGRGLAGLAHAGDHPWAGIREDQLPDQAPAVRAPRSDDPADSQKITEYRSSPGSIVVLFPLPWGR